MKQQQSLRVIDASPAEETEDAPVAEPATFYEGAGEVQLQEYGSYSFPRFITAVVDELGKEFSADDARLVDEMGDTGDVYFGLLLTFPDESLLFVGSDPTAKDAIPWFAFVIEPMAPFPTPESAQDALDLLKPPSVQDVLHEDDWLPARHGEWWLLPTQCVPAGTVFKPGVSSKPYGPSPLGNHVPREYVFTVSDGMIMDRFQERVGAAPPSVEAPSEAIEWTWRQLQKVNPPDDTPTWAEIREFGGDVIVRGTVRHRDDDHFVENLGEVWHTAETHDFEVYTGDEMATDVHLDYHGQ